MTPERNALKDLAAAVRETGVLARPTSAPHHFQLVPPGLLRAAAAVMDVGVFTIAMFFLCPLVLVILDFNSDAVEAWTANIVVFTFAIGFLVSEAAWGRSIGKLRAGLRVIPLDDSRARLPLLYRFILRSLPLFVGIAMSTAGLAGAFGKHRLLRDPNSIILLIPLTLMAMILLSLPFGSGHSPWYDRVAGTRVARRATLSRQRGFEPVIRG